MANKAPNSDDLSSAALQEVRDFHDFLAGWFSGGSPTGGDVLAEQRRRFDPGLQYITPSGGVRDWAMIEDLLVETYGGEPSIDIEVRNALVRHADDHSVLVTYEEHQTGGIEDNSRLTTALFVPKPDAPNGVGWFHVHEVWLVSD
jgi:hypothetical protein